MITPPLSMGPVRMSYFLKLVLPRILWTLGIRLISSSLETIGESQTAARDGCQRNSGASLTMSRRGFGLKCQADSVGGSGPSRIAGHYPAIGACSIAGSPIDRHPVHKKN